MLFVCDSVVVSDVVWYYFCVSMAVDDVIMMSCNISMFVSVDDVYINPLTGNIALLYQLHPP